MNILVDLNEAEKPSRECTKRVSRTLPLISIQCLAGPPETLNEIELTVVQQHTLVTTFSFTKGWGWNLPK